MGRALDPVAADLIGRARELAPIFAERAQRTEDQRAPLDETVRDLIDSGVLATLTPKAYGGYELSIHDMTEIVRIFSAACPSTGWVASFYMGAAWRANLFGAKVQREIFADKPYDLGAGQAAPLREARRVSGGYVVSGQTPWSSGSMHAEWIMFMGVVIDDGVPAPTLFMVPREETEVVDTWYITGMRGTGSNDIRVEEVFVPQYRSASFADALTGTAEGQLLHPNPMYHLPFVPFTMCEVVPVVVGALRGAVESFSLRTAQRQGTLSLEKAAGKQAAQIRLGRALASADAAETLLQAYIDRLLIRRPGYTEPADRAEMKLKGAYISNLCRDAMNEIARGIGGDGFRDDSPLQRFFRDINVMSVHAFLDLDNASENIGRNTLGLPLEDRVI
ncbi:acyl-CoA dehydrogenase family protein [Mycobacterium intracellulare]|nr:acyl-CoA dehydrogenase family protein [Mycobacterium intracellulare]MCA2328518.1 acyl-CoA dehydrogenase family protein [Mycobacterium intracellulare]